MNIITLATIFLSQYNITISEMLLQLHNVIISSFFYCALDHNLSNLQLLINLVICTIKI